MPRGEHRSFAAGRLSAFKNRGENVQSDLLHKYQSKDDILILTVRLAVIVAVILTVPVLFFTVRSSLFELARKTKFDLCRHVLVTFVLLVIINLLVIFIPTMKDIFGVVGVTSANMLIFILPSSLYLKITHQDGASLFLALGIMFSLVSIPLVIYDWVQSGGSTEGSD
uniref:Amino acid transporter transmembrane domain-containing protein n=1 Tax=Pavo cristatus TaxID=9049 RepID=A0A8C9LC91_PAVCR